MSYYTKNNVSVLYPVGAIINYCAPINSNDSIIGWLNCDGSLVSRSTYSDLFAVIGINFGAGDGSTTFNLPNFKNRFAQGNSTPVLTNINSTETSPKKINIENLPSHFHAGTTKDGGAHNHIFTTQSQKSGDSKGGFTPIYLSWWASMGSTPWNMITNNTGGQHTHTFTTTSSLGNDPIVLSPPNITMLFLIKY